MLSKLDKAIVGLISQDIPLVREPFRELAHKLGIKEETLIARIKSYKKYGLMRKFSASLNHRKAGFKHNVMAVWNVPDKLIDRAGNLMASFPEVSHCYERKRARDWNYNLYSMIHGRTQTPPFLKLQSVMVATQTAGAPILPHRQPTAAWAGVPVVSSAAPSSSAAPMTILRIGSSLLEKAVSVRH